VVAASSFFSCPYLEIVLRAAIPRSLGAGDGSAKRSPRLLTGGKVLFNEERANRMKALIDWCTCTFAFDGNVKAFLEHMARVTGLMFAADERRCRRGYTDGIQIKAFHNLQMVPFAVFAWGGESQRGRAMLDLSGSSCGCIGDWRMFRCFLESLPEARLTRVDVAVDCLNGEYTVDQGVQWVQDGAFNCRGREPGTRMDSVFNMKAPLHFFVCIVLACAGSFARAEAPQTMYKIRPSTEGVAFPSDLFPTKKAACEAAGPVWKASSVGMSGWGAPYWVGGSTCMATPFQPNVHWDFAKLDEVWGCSNGSAPDYSKPWEERCDASAPPAPTCVAGTVSRETFFSGRGSLDSPVSQYDLAPHPTSDGQCNVDYDTVERCYSVKNDAGTGKDFYCVFSGKMDGTASPQGTPEPSMLPPEESRAPAEIKLNPALGQGCPKGTVNIGTDSTGGSICAGKGTSPQTPPKKEVKEAPTTTTNDDGSTTKTEVTHTTNADGSVTTKTKTTRTDANGRVTTDESSVTGPVPGTGGGGGSGGGGTGGGSGGTPGQSDADKNDLCAKNPNLNICRNSSVSGECGNTSCEGDAIQCAIYRSQQKTACQWEKENAANTLYGQVMGGNDPLGNKLPTKENATEIGFDTLDQTAFLGGGACFPDKTIFVMGQSVTLPFSASCQYIEWLRFVMMTIAALVSLKILRGPVLGS